MSIYINVNVYSLDIQQFAELSKNVNSLKKIKVYYESLTRDKRRTKYDMQVFSNNKVTLI